MDPGNLARSRSFEDYHSALAADRKSLFAFFRAAVPYPLTEFRLDQAYSGPAGDQETPGIRVRSCPSGLGGTVGNGERHISVRLGAQENVRPEDELTVLSMACGIHIDSGYQEDFYQDARK